MQENTIIEKPKIGPFFWIFLISAVLLISVFIIRQTFLLPVNTDTLKGIVIDESKNKTGPIKKYFPKPYSVKDLARGDYDRH